MPTGAGKTITAQAIVQQAVQSGRRVLWLAHRTELLDQARQLLPSDVLVSTVQLLLSTGQRPPADLVVLDECHHYVAAQWRTVLTPYDKIVGLTATPERDDGTALGDLFDEMFVGACYSDLLAAGHLVKCEIFAPDRRLRGAIAMPPQEAVARYCRDRPTIIYSATIAEAKDHCENTIFGAMNPDARHEMLENFKTGKIKTISNIFVLTEGWDAPCASGLVLARGCSAVSTYLQICGRVLRPYPGKDRAVIVDLTGSSVIHGSPTEDRTYSLTKGILRTKTNKTIWRCKFCGYSVWSKPDSICPLCRCQIPEPDALRLERMRLFRKVENAQASPQDRASAYKGLLAKAAACGYKSGWAARVYQSRYGRWPWEG
jgi:superfamily II DNA or RNA helicase